MNSNQIIELLNSPLFVKHAHTPQEWFYRVVFDDLSDVKQFIDDEEFTKSFEKLGKFKLVDFVGGKLAGDFYSIVYHFEDHDIYLEFYGTTNCDNASRKAIPNFDTVYEGVRSVSKTFEQVWTFTYKMD